MSEARRRASCVFHAEGKFLFSVASDSVRGEFILPVGGIVEPDESPKMPSSARFGRNSGWRSALLAALEDVFDYGGEVVRGTVFCFLAEAESIEGFPETAREEDGEEFPLEWFAMERLRDESRPVFPKGLLEALDGFG